MAVSMISCLVLVCENVCNLPCLFSFMFSVLCVDSRSQLLNFDGEASCGVEEFTMSKRSERITGEKERKNEVNCELGLFSIFESHPGCTSRKLIPNGRPISKDIMNVDTSEKIVRDSIRGDVLTKKHRKKQIIYDKQKPGETDSKVSDVAATNRTIASKIHQSSSKSTSLHLGNTAKLNVAAILEATYDQIHKDDDIHYGGAVDEINFQLVQMSAKAFVDQMFLDKKFAGKEVASSESKPFSDALEILDSNKDLFVELLQDPNSVLARYVKNLDKSRIEKRTSKAISGVNFSKSSSKGEGSFEKYECKEKCPSKGSFTHQPLDKIVVLKPTPKKVKQPENVSCHCSSLQSLHSSSSKGPDEKRMYFFRDMKRKLKYSFRGIGTTADSSTTVKTNDELCKKQNLKSRYITDTSTTKEKVDENLDLSRVNFSEKQEYDVILEAKRHLSARLKNVTTIQIQEGKKIPKTLGRILSSPEVNVCSDINDQKIDGQANTAEANGILQPGNIHTLEVLKESNSIEFSCFTKTNNASKMEKDDSSATYLTLESPSDDQIFTSASDSSPSSPRIFQLHLAHGSKDQEMHPSPVSVLDPVFTDDSTSPSSMVPQSRSGRQALQPLRIDFEQYSHDISPIDPPANPTATVDKQDSISSYVHSVLEASHLRWNNLSVNGEVPQQLLHSSLHDEVNFLPTELHCDPKLLLDHINEVLLEIYQRQINSSPWLSFIKPETGCAPLEDHILDEVTEKVKSCVLPQLGPLTLDLLTGSDITKSRSWLDLRPDTEEIAINISEEILEESIVGTILELDSRRTCI